MADVFDRIRDQRLGVDVSANMPAKTGGDIFDRIRDQRLGAFDTQYGETPAPAEGSFGDNFTPEIAGLAFNEIAGTYSSIAAAGLGIVPEIIAPITGAAAGGMSALAAEWDDYDKTTGAEAFTHTLTAVGEWWYDRVTENILDGVSTDNEKAHKYYEAVGEGFEWALDHAGKGGVGMGQTFVRPWIERMGGEWTPELEARFYAYTKGGVAAALFALPFKKFGGRVFKPEATARAKLAEVPGAEAATAEVATRAERARYEKNLADRNITDKDVFAEALHDAASEGVQHAAMEAMWDQAAKGVARADYSVVEFSRYNRANELNVPRLPKPEGVAVDWAPTERPLSSRIDAMPILSERWYYKHAWRGDAPDYKQAVNDFDKMPEAERTLFNEAYNSYTMHQYEVNVRIARDRAAFRDKELTQQDERVGVLEADVSAATQRINDAILKNMKEAQERLEAAQDDHLAMRNSPRQRQAMDSGEAAFRGNSIVQHEAGFSGALAKAAREILENDDIMTGNPEARKTVVEFLRRMGAPVNYGDTLYQMKAHLARIDASMPRQRIEPSNPLITKKPKSPRDANRPLDPTRLDYDIPGRGKHGMRGWQPSDIKFNLWERLALLKELYGMEQAVRHPRHGVIRQQHQVTPLGEQVEAQIGTAASQFAEPGVVGPSGRFYTPAEASLMRMMVEEIIGIETLIVPLEQMTPTSITIPYSGVAAGRVPLGMKVGVKLADVPAVAQRYAVTKFGVEVAPLAARAPYSNIRTMADAGFKRRGAKPDPAYPRDIGIAEPEPTGMWPSQEFASELARLKRAAEPAMPELTARRLKWRAKRAAAQRRRDFKKILDTTQKTPRDPVGEPVIRRGPAELPVHTHEAIMGTWAEARKMARMVELKRNRSASLEQYKQVAADSGYENLMAMLRDADMELVARFAIELGIDASQRISRQRLMMQIVKRDGEMIGSQALSQMRKRDVPAMTHSKQGEVPLHQVRSYTEELLRGKMPEDPVPAPKAELPAVRPPEQLRQIIKALGRKKAQADEVAALREELAQSLVRQKNERLRASPKKVKELPVAEALVADTKKAAKAIRLTDKAKQAEKKGEAAAKAELKREMAEYDRARQALLRSRRSQKGAFTRQKRAEERRRGAMTAEQRWSEDMQEAKAFSQAERERLQAQKTRPISGRTPRGRQRGAVDFAAIFEPIVKMFRRHEGVKYGRPASAKYKNDAKDFHKYAGAKEVFMGAQAVTPLVKKLGQLLDANPAATALGTLMSNFNILPAWTWTKAIGKQQSYYNMRNKIRGMLITGSQFKGSLANTLQEHGGHWFVGVREWLPDFVSGTRGGLSDAANMGLVRGLMGIGEETAMVKGVRRTLDRAHEMMAKASTTTAPYVKNYFPYKLKRGLKPAQLDALVDKVMKAGRKSGKAMDRDTVASQIYGMGRAEGWLRMKPGVRDTRTYAKENWHMERVRKVLDDVPAEEMLEFIDTDAAHVLTGYLRDASDRIAYALKFGAHDEKFIQMRDKAVKELNEAGMGMSPEDLVLLDDLLNITQRTYHIPGQQWWTEAQRVGIAWANWAKLMMVVPGSAVEALIPLTNRTMQRAYIPALAAAVVEHPVRAIARQIYRAPPSKKTGFGTLGYDEVVGEVIGKVVDVTNMDLLTATHAADVGSKLSNAAFVANGLHMFTNTLQTAMIKTFRMSMERAMLREAEIRTGRRKRTAAHDEDMMMFEYYGVKPEAGMRWLKDGAKIDGAFFVRDYAPALINYLQDGVMTARGVNQPKWHSNSNYAFLRHLKTYVTMFGNTVVPRMMHEMSGKVFRESPNHIGLRVGNAARTLGVGYAMYQVAWASESVMDWWKYGGSENHPLMERLDGTDEENAAAMAKRAINRWAVTGFPGSLMFDMWESGIYSGRGFADEDDMGDLLQGTIGKDALRALSLAMAAYHGLEEDGEGPDAEQVAKFLVGIMPTSTLWPRNDQSPAEEYMMSKDEWVQWITAGLEDLGID